jgi:hypothetical protein
VNTVAPTDERTLREQLAKARERLEGLVAKVRAVDGELEALAGEREQHRLLRDVCASLGRLEELGGARLFWGDRAVDTEVAQRIRYAWSQIDSFEKRLSEIQERREALVDEIEEHEQGAWFLEGEILEAQEQAERAREEWILEREVDFFPARAAVMPWMRSGEEDQRFRKSLSTSLLLGLLFALVVPQIDLPIPVLPEAIDVPERLTRLIPERPRTPPPVPQQTRPEQVKPEPVEKLAADQAPPKRGPENAPKEAPGSRGILAFREQFAGLAVNRPIAALGVKARINRDGEVASGAPTRSMVTSRAPGSSGGINLAALSRGVGGGSGQQLEGVELARATSSIVAIGDGGGRGSEHGVDGGGPPVGRTDEEIQIVFDRHKAALYRLYNRELRSDPSLRGQMVLRLRIEPDGSVSLCELQATDMNALQLSAQVVERVRTFDFGAKDVPAITILYPIDFLPAT